MGCGTAGVRNGMRFRLREIISRVKSLVRRVPLGSVHRTRAGRPGRSGHGASTTRSALHSSKRTSPFHPWLLNLLLRPALTLPVPTLARANRPSGPVVPRHRRIPVPSDGGVASRSVAPASDHGHEPLPAVLLFGRDRGEPFVEPVVDVGGGLDRGRGSGLGRIRVGRRPGRGACSSQS